MEKTPKQIFTLLYELLKESGAERAQRIVSLEADLERDLGIDSLERAELFFRLEKTFGVHFPDDVMAHAKTVRDLALAVEQANPRLKFSESKYVEALQSVGIDLSQSQTLVEVLQLYAEKAPDRPHIYLQDEFGEEQVISYGDLFQRALSVAFNLKQAGLHQGECAAIMLPTSQEFFYVFFGILLVGAVPVPIYPPYRPDRIEEYAMREVGILRNAEVRLLITFHDAENLSKLLKIFVPSLNTVVTAQSLLGRDESFSPQTVKGENFALIQYTSGSTGLPKGVVLTHQNLLSNLRAFGEGAQITSSDSVVSWLPLYHDMGLIGSWMGSLYYGIPATILSPLTFLNHPSRWLWAIHYHRATLSVAPNFAFELCIRKIDAKDIEGLDLSTWRLAANAAEAIYPKTLERFTKKFAPYGFREESLFPVYGLAENSVALALPPVGRKPRIDRVRRDELEKHNQALPVREEDTGVLEFVSVGQAIPRHEIRIVDENNQLAPDRTIGSLQFRGPSAMQGYHNNPQATQAIHHDGWWDSGDFAYRADNEIYITGRKKDIIIKAGRNLSPDAVEEITAQVQGIRKGCVIAFGVGDPTTGTEKFVVVAETNAGEGDKEKIEALIMEKISLGIGIPPDQIVLIPPRTLPKTSSGKLQRSACRQMYEKKQLGKTPSPPWLQISRVAFRALLKKMGALTLTFFQFLYAFYIGILLALTLPVIYFVVLTSSRRISARSIKIFARSFLFLIACPLFAKKRYTTPHRPFLYVVNHASYVDALVLLAVLPSDLIFVGKKELASAPLLKTFFKKLDYLTVDRLDFSQNLADTEKIQNALRQGKSIVIFPEGTFTHLTGLRPFKHGAFKVAVDTQTPIFPVALSGTRKILQGGSLLPHWGIIRVTMCEAIYPSGKEWNEVVRLRSLAHAEIAKYCGEPALDLD